MCCNVLQCVAVCVCGGLLGSVDDEVCVSKYVAVCCSVLQCVAVCCRVVQCVAVCSSGSVVDCWVLLMAGWVCCSALQSVTVC